jgi:predicted metal-binding protein
MIDNHPDQAPVRLTVCVICTDTSSGGEAGIGAGEQLHRQLCDALAGHPARDCIEIQPYRCLMACSEGCLVSVAQPGKMQYLLARLSATAEKSAELLDFAALYVESPTGIVPNHLWPGGLALHFHGRIPPLQPNPDAVWTQNGCDL